MKRNELILKGVEAALEPPRVDMSKGGGPQYVRPIFKKSITIPDPGERTPNDPVYLMNSDNVLKLIKGTMRPDWPVYDQIGNHVGELMDAGKEVIKEEFLWAVFELAKEAGWKEVKLIGKQLLFISFLDS